MDPPPDEMISIIIPTLNEADRIGTALDGAARGWTVELIVVDGGSRDRTVEVCRSFDGVRVLRSSPGRAHQMNEGARAARGGHLLFLHADTRLPPNYDRHIRALLARPGVAAGAFRLRIDGDGAWFRAIEMVANWRSRLLGLPYGDQGLFLKTELFRELDGFREMPIMEDFELVRRLTRRGRIAIAEAEAPTSARRWRRVGPLRTTLLNQAILLGYHLGLDAGMLARWYGRGSDGRRQG